MTPPKMIRLSGATHARLRRTASRLGYSMTVLADNLVKHGLIEIKANRLTIGTKTKP